jgi:hypothetical protein
MRVRLKMESIIFMPLKENPISVRIMLDLNRLLALITNKGVEDLLLVRLKDQ